MEFIYDYITNPKSEKFNSPDYPVNVRYVMVSNKPSANRQNVVRGFMQCRSVEQAQTIIEYWQAHDKYHTYILTQTWRR